MVLLTIKFGSRFGCFSNIKKVLEQSRLGCKRESQLASHGSYGYGAKVKLQLPNCCSLASCLIIKVNWLVPWNLR